MDQRDKIWNKVFHVYYDTYFMELLSSRLIDRWKFVDDLTNILIAITASGSAISGWALWNTPNFKSFWILIAGLGAVFSILHSAIGVSARLRTWVELKRQATSLRLDIENHRNHMEIFPDFDVEELNSRLGELRKRYTNTYVNVSSDILKTRRFERKTQELLNSKLKEYYITASIDKSKQAYTKSELFKNGQTTSQTTKILTPLDTPNDRPNAGPSPGGENLLPG